MRRRLLLLFTALLAGPAVAAPSAPPLGWHPPVAGDRTRIMTLGSAHLSGIRSVTPAMLEPLLARLAGFRPTIITHEGVPGEQCDMMRRSPRYADAVANYCWDPAPAQKLAGKTQQEAEEAAETLLERGGPRTPAERRRLALLFLAANERASAWVQWLRLVPGERIAADGLDPAMIDVLERKGKARNESYDVAAMLAARLGLERVYSVDDHSSDGAMRHTDGPFEATMTRHFARGRASPLVAEEQKFEASLKDGASMLAFYRWLNDPTIAAKQGRMDFGGAQSAADLAPYGRHYAAWWDVRNLRMAANIRATTVEHPGGRVLNIVGSSHKPYYDWLLSQMGDVEVVPVQPFLR
ncbi:hypothetical protein HMF7854_13595 [Sphingomonas ginkgonis]|uniref:TraB/GumN family protein n=1 Tax=Sphingomonas ginkgonis TaxID=2315330 RepID=A0A429VCZ4_9SPHN|nr:DUF5694 domain-containing protein [Sphingomonas ginkgonis]RST31756.1 hypothetical protein HMF7854_13595 [Sphingomonas ginkgonis]